MPILRVESYCWHQMRYRLFWVPVSVSSVEDVHLISAEVEFRRPLKFKLPMAADGLEIMRWSWAVLWQNLTMCLNYVDTRARDGHALSRIQLYKRMKESLLVKGMQQL